MYLPSKSCPKLHTNYKLLGEVVKVQIYRAMLYKCDAVQVNIWNSLFNVFWMYAVLQKMKKKVLDFDYILVFFWSWMFSSQDVFILL